MTHEFRYDRSSLYGLAEIHRCTCGEEIYVVTHQPVVGLDLMKKHIEESR